MKVEMGTLTKRLAILQAEWLIANIDIITRDLEIARKSSFGVFVKGRCMSTDHPELVEACKKLFVRQLELDKGCFEQRLERSSFDDLLVAYHHRKGRDG